MTDAADDDEAVIRPFVNWLREIQGGRTHDELSHKLHDLIGAVVETGKKGTLQLTVTIRPMKNNTAVLTVDDSIKVAMPAYDRASTIFFPDKHGNLTRQDPNQLSFPTVAAVPDQGPAINLDSQEATQ